MIGVIQKAWGWTGMKPDAVVASNAFGNVIVRAKDGKYWRICPEDLSCDVLANDNEDYEALVATREFEEDWDMHALLQVARARFGPPPGDRCYCLKLPAPLGGEYVEANISTISREEIIMFSGDVAKQIKDLPDGAKVEFKFQGWHA